MRPWELDRPPWRRVDAAMRKSLLDQLARLPVANGSHCPSRCIAARTAGVERVLLWRPDVLDRKPGSAFAEPGPVLPRKAWPTRRVWSIQLIDS